MSFADTVAVTALRAALVAFAAAWLGRALAVGLPAWSARRAWLAWTAVLLPFITPVLLVGYAYRRQALALGPGSWGVELGYTLLLLLRLAPLAALLHALAPPPPLTCEARHVLRALGPRHLGLAQRWRCWRQGTISAYALTAAAVFLLGFQEFELASLLQATAWTNQMFAAYAVQGLRLGESLRWALWPLALELALLLGVWRLLRGLAAQPGALPPPAVRPGRGRALYIVAALGLATCLPLGIVVVDTAAAAGGLVEAVRYLPEILSALVFALVVAVASLGLATWLPRLGRGGAIFLAGLSAVGLLGPWALGLGLLGLFGSGPLAELRDSPLPLLLGGTVLFLPPALLLALLLRRRALAPALHLAALLRDARRRRVPGAAAALRRRLLRGGQGGALGLIFFLAYFELTLSFLLAPIDLNPIAVLLYNQMHYGRMPAWSALLLLSLLAPLAALALARGLGRLASGQHG